MMYKVPVRTMQYLIHFSPVRIEYNKYEQQVVLRTTYLFFLYVCGIVRSPVFHDLSKGA